MRGARAVHGGAPASPQHGCATTTLLNIALLIDREHERVLRRGEVEADVVGDLAILRDTR